MLEFINNNPILATGIFGILAAIISSLITAISALHIEKKKLERSNVSKLEDQIETITLKLKSTEEELLKYTRIEDIEKSIDKSKGAVYVETLANGSSRCICGYCWETKHLKIPINVTRDATYGLSGFCENCKTECSEKDFSSNYGNYPNETENFWDD